MTASTTTPTAPTTQEDVRAAAIAAVEAIDGVHQALLELARVAEGWIEAPRLYHVIASEAEAIARTFEQDEDEVRLEVLRNDLRDYLELVELAGKRRLGDA